MIKNLKFKIKVYPERSRRAFTIIEILVVIFLFSVLILLSSSSLVTGFLSGRLRSSSDKALNRDLGLTMDIIRQKMANANEICSIEDRDVYGFGYLNDPEKNEKFLAIASKGQTDNLCTLIGWRNSDKSLWIQEAINTHISFVPSTDDIRANEWKKINSDGINITDFKIVPYVPYISSPKNIPYFTVTLTGEDTRTQAKTTFTDTFIVPYETVQRWQ